MLTLSSTENLQTVFSPELKGLEIGNSATDKSIEVEAFVHEEQDAAGKYDDVYHFVSSMY